ncbi:ATP-NAD kinase-like domain-containing protein [Syncephalis fuscata]|nr:ATP-NAD kinase-like domain-containing protein [Syncephalis fuscata]
MTGDNKVMNEFTAMEGSTFTEVKPSHSDSKDIINTSQDTVSIGSDEFTVNNSSDDISNTCSGDSRVLHQQEGVNSWWKGGGSRYLAGTLQLARETMSTYDKTSKRTAAFLIWSHCTSPTDTKSISRSSTLRLRRALTMKKKSKDNRVIRVPLERCYAVHRTSLSILSEGYQGSSVVDGGGSNLFSALAALKHIAPIEGLNDADQFAEKLKITTRQLEAERENRSEEAKSGQYLVTVFGVEQTGLKSRLRAWTFAFFSDVMADAWTMWLRQEIYGPKGLPPRSHILAILNPFGGTRSAKHIYQQIVEPMMKLSGVNVTLLETKRAKHATEFVRELDLSQYDGLVSVSGDGLYHEIVNGLLSREDWKKACQFPIGIIPAGSGNAMAVSVDQPTPELATTSAICGQVRPMDIMAITSLERQEVFYAHEMVTWSLVADIDIEADRFRWAGPVRFTMSGLWRIISLRRYKARIHYLLDEKDPSASKLSKSVEKVEEEKDPQVLDASVPSSRHGPSLKYTQFCQGQTDPSSLALPKHWQSYEGPIAHFIASSLPWISADAYVAPTAGISSGHIDLIWMAEPDHGLQLIPLLTDNGRGEYLKSPHARWHQVRAMILEPLGRVRDANLRGIMDVDGEVVPCEALAVECLPGLARMMVPNWLDEAQVARRV